jgi:hypothetical protein
MKAKMFISELLFGKALKTTELSTKDTIGLIWPRQEEMTRARFTGQKSLEPLAANTKAHIRVSKIGAGGVTLIL